MQRKMYEKVIDVILFVIFRSLVGTADVFNRIASRCLAAAAFMLGSDQ